MQSLSLPQKIGQLLMCGFDSTEVDSHIMRMIRDYHIGGVILFKRNIASPEQIKTLNIALQQLNAETHELPLMISIDQEGGVVARVEAGITYLPGAMALAAAQDPQGVHDIYAAVGKELRALGIHINFAPVADVNNNAKNPVIGVRSFGEDVEEVSGLIQRAIEGLKDAQVVAVAKHFPGHGDTTVDSHMGLPRIMHDQARLNAIELKPFAKAIQAGVPAIMSAHVIVPALDPKEVPCTLSYPVLTELLRKKLGFGGVIFTDCLEMKAIADHYGVVEGAVQAFEAGADVLLISHTQAHQIAFIETMLQHVKSGRVSEQRIDASVQRILALKSHYQMQEEMAAPLRAPYAVALSEKLSQASITLIQDRLKLLPLKPELKTLVITARVGIKTEIDALMPQQGSLGAQLKAEIPICDEIFIRATTTSEESESVLQQAAEYEQIIVMSYNAILLPTQATLINALAKAHPRLIVVAGRLPYDLQSLPDVSTFVAAYENRAEAMASVTQVLLGKAVAIGKLPVTVLENEAGRVPPQEDALFVS
jgi:beta-N-acetylhexosaminidase